MLADQLLEATLNAIRHGVIVYDADLVVTALNDRAREILRIPESDFSLGEPFEKLVQLAASFGGYGGVGTIDARVEQRMVLARTFEPLSNDQQLGNGEFFEVFGQPFDGGNFVLTFTDITERVRANESLRDLSERYKQLFENTNEGWWFIRPDGETLDVNSALFKLLKTPREALMKRTIYDFVDDENRQIFEQQLERRKTGLSASYEIALTRPDGSKIPCINSPTPIYDDSGKHIGSIGCGRI